MLFFMGNGRETYRMDILAASGRKRATFIRDATSIGGNMIAPDRAFLRDLKLMDKRLGVKFNDRNFVITYDRGYGDPVNIHTVKVDGGGFRQPDQRDLIFVKSGDLENESMKEKLLKLSAHSYDIRRKMREKAHDDIRHMTRDNKIQLINTVLRKDNARKANSAFRRISP